MLMVSVSRLIKDIIFILSSFLLHHSSCHLFYSVAVFICISGYSKMKVFPRIFFSKEEYSLHEVNHSDVTKLKGQ